MTDPVRLARTCVPRRDALRSLLGVGSLLVGGEGLATTLLGGCGAIAFDASQQIPEQKITGNLIAGVLGNFLPSPFTLQINLEQETKAHGTGPAHSAGLKALSFKLTRIPSPPRSTDNFDFVDRIELFIESTKAGTQLMKQKVADLLTVPRSVQVLNFQCYPTVDLVPYINEGARISSAASGRVPQADVYFDGLLTVEIRV